MYNLEISFQNLTKQKDDTLEKNTNIPNRKLTAC